MHIIRLTYNETDETLYFVKEDGSSVKKHLRKEPDSFKRVFYQYITELDDHEGITDAKATVDDSTGTPSVEVSIIGEEEKTISFTFSGLKGEIFCYS